MRYFEAEWDETLGQQTHERCLDFACMRLDVSVHIFLTPAK